MRSSKVQTPEWVIEPDVTVLNMSFKDLKDEGASQLADALMKPNQVRTLNASWNDIGDRGASKLAKVVEKNEIMTELDLTGNKIKDSGAVRLAAALKVNKKLRTLKLEHNVIGAKGIEKLMEVFDRSESLENLILKANEFKDGNQVEKLGMIASRKSSVREGEMPVITEDTAMCASPVVSEVDDEEHAPAAKGGGPPQHRPLSGSMIVPALQVYADQQAKQDVKEGKKDEGGKGNKEQVQNGEKVEKIEKVEKVENGTEIKNKDSIKEMDEKLAAIDDASTVSCLEQAVLCFVDSHMDSPRHIRSMHRLQKYERPQGPSKMAKAVNGDGYSDWEAPPKPVAPAARSPFCPGPCY
mmetsp:Transcript_70018/g.121175  ORF Transcript_70018/g.121175 Transcript_70018/m.121175 type:complete len:354 (-) Transcript_70018:24-1085(-)